jgi:hypothetical protein
MHCDVDLSLSIIQDTMNLSEKGSSLVLGQKHIIRELDPAERMRILRKVDWHILPLVTLFYLLSFL